MKNLMIIARAGTGKTTTMEWAVAGTPAGVVLSDEQEAIVSAVNRHPYKTGTMVAFSKAIATELQTRLKKSEVSGFSASTNHSSGLQIIRQNSSNGVRIDSWKYKKLMDECLGPPKKKQDYDLRNSTNTILDLARSNMLGVKQEEALQLSFDEVDYLRDYFGVNGECSTAEILDLANRVLMIGSASTKTIDFTDMIWMPAFYDLRVDQQDLVIVDECQDLNRAQQALVAKLGKRMITVGDDRQAIFGFAGADAQSMSRLSDMMDLRGGVETLMLTKTRRCPKKVVEQASRIVEDYRCFDDAPEGEWKDLDSSQFGDRLRDAHSSQEDLMVLCRTNAPLVSYAFSLIKQRIPVQIRGRDIGKSIATLIKKIAGRTQDIALFQGKLEAYREKESQRIAKYRYGVEEKQTQLDDKIQVIESTLEGSKNVSAAIAEVEKLFSDEARKGAIQFSSAHRSKGLEADHIYILRPELLPHPKLIQKQMGEQEMNLKYVAYTRAKQSVTIVA